MKHLTIAALLAALSVLPACKQEDTKRPDGAPRPPSHSRDDQSTGLGITYSGKIGIGLAPGLVMPLDGSGPTFGMGF